MERTASATRADSTPSAYSSASNIAEGCAKKGKAEFRRYLNITLGSLSELSYTLLLAKDLGLLSETEWGHLDELHKKAGGMTWLLYKSLLPKKPSAEEMG
jgi:four helix bundle protein